MRTLIAANWKMHGNSSWVDKPAEFGSILPQSKREGVDVLICPPALFLAAMTANTQGVFIGAQNCHHEDKGAHTGEISAEMVKDAGADYVIVGHSERREGGETNRAVQAKAASACRHGLTPIICVGESLSQREAGEAEAVVAAQLAASMPEGETSIVVAYEPIWAIGTGKVPTIEDIGSMHNHIRKIVGKGVRILYGGSVKPGNAREILAVENVNGALIGGASLEMDSLAKIAQAVAVSS